jgi:hypothetical protein
MPNWKKVILSGNNATLAEITASGNLSGSGTATASYGLFTGSFGGDGTNLDLSSNTSISTSPFPFAGDAQISGSLVISQSYTAGDTDSTALRLIGSGSVSQSGIFEVEGSAGPLFSVADGLDGVLMEVNNISGLPLFQVSSSNEVFVNRGNLTSGVTTATASFAYFTGSFAGDASRLTNVPAGTTPTLDAVTTQGNVTTNAITAGTISGSAFKLNNANALSHTGNVLYVGNANDWTTVELGRETTDEIHVNGLLKAEQLLRAEQSAQITGSLIVAGANSGTAPTTQSLKIDSSGYFYHLGRYTGNSAAFGTNKTNIAIGNDISTDGDYGWVVIGDSALASDTFNSGVVIGRQAQGIATGAITIGVLSKVYDTYGISLGVHAGNNSNAKGINIGAYAKGQGDNNIVLSSLGAVNVEPTKANTFGIYMTDASPNFEIEATGSSTLSGSSFTIEKSGSTVFSVIGSEGTLFSVDDDLDGTIFTANDRSGLPVLEASASGEVYIGKAPQSLYTTAVISSNNANVTQSIYGLDTSSYGGAFFEYTAHSGSNARAGNIMSVWNGSSLNFTETTTTDIGSTSDLVMKVHISESQAQLAAFSTNAGYNIKTIIKSI